MTLAAACVLLSVVQLAVATPAQAGRLHFRAWLELDSGRVYLMVAMVNKTNTSFRVSAQTGVVVDDDTPYKGDDRPEFDTEAQDILLHYNDALHGGRVFSVDPGGVHSARYTLLPIRCGSAPATVRSEHGDSHEQTAELQAGIIFELAGLGGVGSRTVSFVTNILPYTCPSP